ncbi:uncharacterized protein [Haliotis asinina]|uniref:uncharacterized protein n=1 Tax=Haliotis asinina TaxID=109174 RepID=UPI0035327F9B
MDTFNDLDTSQKVLYVVGGAAVVIVTVVGLRKLCFKKTKAKKDYPRDTVIHHQIGRGPYAPSMTPFAVKLETYLRMAKIPYQNDHGMEPSSKGKLTWIEYNGHEVADSSLCIKFLNKKMSVDLNRSLSPADRGIAQAMQAMAEDHIYWLIGLFRWQYDNDKSFVMNALKLSKFTFWKFQRVLEKEAWSQGLGRHTEDEVAEMFKKDLQSLSDFIGMKKFLMGDEPCETDCAVFGQLSQVYWHFIGTGHDNILKDKYPTLAAYCERMKEAFWPDWDQCITHGGKREATKYSQETTERVMDTFNDLNTSHKVLYVVGGAAVAIVTVVGLRKLCFKETKTKKDYPRDTVIHHQTGRGPYVPSLTPYSVKLETYLRMAKISYQNVHGFQPSSKGKYTWIEYNGQAVADSTLCINFLNKKMGVDLNRNLSPAEKGVAQAMQTMVEDHLYWLIAIFRWQFDNDKSFIVNALKLSKFMLWTYRRLMTNQAWNQGLGRHTEDEATEMFKKDLQSLSDFIGTKKFLMGDEPCETDSAVFGQLSQIYWHFIGTGHDNILKDKYPNLAAYCERMKETFWPDWDQCITHGGTREAAK